MGASQSVILTTDQQLDGVFQPKLISILRNAADQNLVTKEIVGASRLDIDQNSVVEGCHIYTGSDPTRVLYVTDMSESVLHQMKDVFLDELHNNSSSTVKMIRELVVSVGGSLSRVDRVVERVTQMVNEYMTVSKINSLLTGTVVPTGPASSNDRTMSIIVPKYDCLNNDNLSLTYEVQLKMVSTRLVSELFMAAVQDATITQIIFGTSPSPSSMSPAPAPAVICTATRTKYTKGVRRNAGLSLPKTTSSKILVGAGVIALIILGIWLYKKRHTMSGSKISRSM